jgi:catechol 2,3-dioxygenase-like lactoylglutathione lyase family enzyme
MTAALALDHLALPIADVPATLRFYGEVLGLTLVDAHSGDDWGGVPWLMLIFGLADGRQLALCARRGVRPVLGPEGLDLPHIALAVPDHAALQQWERRLVEHAVMVRHEDHGAQRSMYFQGPNGLVLEITAPPSSASAW